MVATAEASSIAGQPVPRGRRGQPAAADPALRDDGGRTDRVADRRELRRRVRALSRGPRVHLGPFRRHPDDLRAAGGRGRGGAVPVPRGPHLPVPDPLDRPRRRIRDRVPAGPGPAPRGTTRPTARSDRGPRHQRAVRGRPGEDRQLVAPRRRGGRRTLVVEPRAGAPRKLVAKGLTHDDASSLADHLAGDPTGAVFSVPVVSARHHYGALAVDGHGGVFAEHSRDALLTYARLAAAALDSADALESARLEANSARVLLELSSSLSRIVGTGDVVAADPGCRARADRLRPRGRLPGGVGRVRRACTEFRLAASSGTRTRSPPCWPTGRSTRQPAPRPTGPTGSPTRRPGNSGPSAPSPHRSAWASRSSASSWPASRPGPSGWPSPRGWPTG